MLEEKQVRIAAGLLLVLGVIAVAGALYWRYSPDPQPEGTTTTTTTPVPPASSNSTLLETSSISAPSPATQTDSTNFVTDEAGSTLARLSISIFHPLHKMYKTVDQWDALEKYGSATDSKTIRIFTFKSVHFNVEIIFEIDQVAQTLLKVVGAIIKIPNQDQMRLQRNFHVYTLAQPSRIFQSSKSTRHYKCNRSIWFDNYGNSNLDTQLNYFEIETGRTEPIDSANPQFEAPANECPA